MKQKKTYSRRIDFIKQYQYKLVIIPIILLLFSLSVLAIQYSQTGEFVKKGITLAGGISLTVETTDTTFVLQDIEESLEEQFSGFDMLVREIMLRGQRIGFTIETTFEETDELRDFAISYFGVSQSDISIEVTGSSLGEQFFRQMQQAIFIALIFMAIVIYFAFRSMVPSVAIIFSVIVNLITVLAIFNLSGMYLSTAGVAAFLMIIGYSVDTNVLLSSKMLKEHETTASQRIVTAAQTGLFMTATTLITLIAAFIITNSAIIGQIMFILIIGLMSDIINTWLFNSAILRWWINRSTRTMTE